MDIELLRDIIKYNPETGELIWKERSDDFPASITSIRAFNTKNANKPIYQEQHRGYLRVCLFGKNYKSHRVAWAIYYGYWPDDQIDHIDGDRSNNRIENLRAASQTENSRNTKIPSTNMSGVIGVFWDKRRFKWEARISENSKSVYLGEFDYFWDAVEARRDAEKKYGYHGNHGRVE